MSNVASLLDPDNWYRAFKTCSGIKESEKAHFMNVLLNDGRSPRPSGLRLVVDNTGRLESRMPPAR